MRVFRPWLHQRGFVYVLSGEEGWSAADAWVALNYAARDNYVVGIDTPAALDYINRTHQGCLFMDGLFEDYSRVQQRAAETPHFYPPTVLGRGTGASLVYLAQIGAPALALGATVMLDPEPRLTLNPPICEHPGTQYPDGVQQITSRRLRPQHAGRLWLDDKASASMHRSLPRFPVIWPRMRRGTDPCAVSMRPHWRISGRGTAQRHGDLPLVEAVAPDQKGKAFAILYSVTAAGGIWIAVSPCCWRRAASMWLESTCCATTGAPRRRKSRHAISPASCNTTSSNGAASRWY